MATILPELPTFKIVDIGALELDEWNHSDSIYPCWRLYWNADEGAWIECSGNHPLDPDRMVLVPPYARVNLRMIGKVRHFYVCFEASPPYAFARRQVYTVPLSEQDRTNVEALFSTVYNGGKSSPLQMAKMIFETMCGIPDEAWDEGMGDARIQSALAKIEERLNNPPTNFELAQALNLATNSFVRLFRKEVGTSPHHYILLRRLTSASQMLRSGATIEQAAEATGFCDRYYFSRMFSNAFGVPPGKYRRGG